MNAGVVCEVAREDEEKSFRNDGVAEDGGVLASLNILELRGESLETVKEFGGFLGFLGTAGHPGYLGVLEDRLCFELSVECREEFLARGFPRGSEKILNIPVLGRYAGGGGLDGA